MATRHETLTRETAPTPCSRFPAPAAENLWGQAAIVSSRPRRRLTQGKAAANVIDSVPHAALRAEIATLNSSQLLVTSGAWRVFGAHANAIPSVLREIGRLRELTFRAAGQGTGKSVDIDSFDAFYLHLFVWDTREEAVVGAYRLGLVDEILATRGKCGLYTHSLFKFPSRVLSGLTQAIELGRSFVRPEYQRSYAPLVLLWRGIGQLIERAPQYATLFGSVSISNAYSPESRRLMIEYLSTYRADTSLMSRVAPRRPYRNQGALSRSGASLAPPRTIEELSSIITDIERDRKGVPILLKHYLRIGGRIVAFSVDRQFANSLDALVRVDLRQTEQSVLDRYLSKAGATAFRAYHDTLGDSSEQRTG
jgi:putative hemolysin